MKPPYVMKIDEHETVVVAPDEESQRALWFLIKNRLGIEQTAAENLLDTGKMLIGNDLIVAREDAFGHFECDRFPNVGIGLQRK